MKQVEINQLIVELQNMQKAGKKNVQIKGTLMCGEAGNLIIASTEKQI